MIVVLHAVGIFVSAFLLFLVQPMIAKAILPRFGGSPAVWNTCLVFFQGALLLGYAYAHATASRLRPRQHLALHAVVVLLPLLLLPPALHESWIPDPDRWPVPILVAVLAASVGLPFFVLSTNGTLVQHWFSRRSTREPYALYAASNAGSLLALLAYPFLVEPWFGVQAQRVLFAAGYGLFAVLTAALMVLAWKAADGRGVAGTALAAGEESPPGAALADGGARIPSGDGWAARGRWAFRSGVASLLLLATTLRVTIDIGSVPLLWVIPLALYLLTFVIAFLPRAPYPRLLLEVVAMLGITLGFVSLCIYGIPLLPGLVLMLGTLFVGAWICHADLAADRPAPQHLTSFYLWVSIGGFAGGVFGNLVAPVLFKSVAEYPVSLVLLAAVIAMPRFRAEGAYPGTWRRHGAVPLLVAVGAVLAVSHAAPEILAPNWTLLGVLLVGIAARPVRASFLATTAAVAVFVSVTQMQSWRVIDTDRSFFGVLHVEENEGKRMMRHGTTLHGGQIREPLSLMPIFYYHPDSPLGRVMQEAPDGARIGIVGMGVGAMAALTREGQHLTYYEIDPLVDRMARRWFSYLENAPGKVDVVLGDARLTLSRETDRFDLLVVDAFSSDSIPVHLLTREAVSLYRDRLAEGGLLALHTSNRYFDLDRVLRASSAELGMGMRLCDFWPKESEYGNDAFPSSVVLLATSNGAFAPFEESCDPSEPDAISRAWTDDHASLLDVVRTWW